MKKAKWITVFLLVQAILLLVGCANPTVQEAESNGSLFPAEGKAEQHQVEVEQPKTGNETPVATSSAGGWVLTKMIQEGSTSGESLEIFVETEFPSNNECIMRFLEEPGAEKAAQTFELVWRSDGQLLKMSMSSSDDPPMVTAQEYAYDTDGHVTQIRVSSESAFESQVGEGYFHHSFGTDGKLAGTKALDEEGNILQSLMYVPLDQDGTLRIDLTNMEWSNSISFYEYDSDGRPLQLANYTLNDGLAQMTNVGVLHYDTAGNLTEITAYDENGELEGRILFEYEQHPGVPELFPVWDVLMQLF